MSFEPVDLRAPPVTLSLLPYGLTIHSLVVQLPSGEERDLLIGHPEPADHHFASHGGRGFRNQTVGRYANRLPSGKVEREGMHTLDLPGDDGVCLHGGAKGIDTQEWTTIDRGASSVFASALFPVGDATYPPQGEESIFRLVSPAGDDGFPLTLEIEGLVQVVKQGLEPTMMVVLRARVMDDGTPELEMNKGTPVNLTVHWGFHLGSFDGVDDEDVRGHTLWIDSSKVVAIDEKMLATGVLDSTKPGDALNFEQGTLEDTSSHRTIGSTFLEHGVDHNLVFNAPATSTAKPRVVLTSPDSRVSLRFFTNQSSVQVYTAAGFDGTSGRKPHHQGHDNPVGGYEQFGAVFLEFHHPLATFLHPTFENDVAGTSTLLYRGDVYENMVKVEVCLS